MYEAPPIKPAAPKVIMYSAVWCRVCKRAAEYFRLHDVPYREYDIEHSTKGIRDYKRLNGRSVPIILVGDQRLDGFSESGFRSLWQAGQGPSLK